MTNWYQSLSSPIFLVQDNFKKTSFLYSILCVVSILVSKLSLFHSFANGEDVSIDSRSWRSQDYSYGTHKRSRLIKSSRIG